MVNGFIISYKENLQIKDITLINYYLFGRIVMRTTKKGKQYYYYPGLFENTPYLKLTNGCYFTEKIIDDFQKRLNIIPTKEITFPTELTFKTAKDYWAAFIKTKQWIVKNFQNEDKL